MNDKFFILNAVLLKFQKNHITYNSRKQKKMLEWLFGKKKQEPQKPKKLQKVQQAEDKWMYDFMLQFLNSPIWKVSILDFVDNKCIVFDNEEQNKFQYTVIHNEFKQLVGNLVDGMMEEIGMSEQKLAEIIEKGLESKEKKIFNQLLLADDFLRFKDFMVKRNKILEQQAIKALQQNQTKSALSQQVYHPNNHQANLLRESQRIQQQRQRKLQEQEQQMVRKAIQMSKIESKQNEAIKALQEKAIDRPKHQQKLNEQVNSAEQNTKTTAKTKPISRLEPIKTTQSSSKTSQLGELPPLKSSLGKPNTSFQKQINPNTVQNVEEKHQISKPIQQTKEELKTEHKEEKATSESLEDRKQRLIAQREKIRKQKEEQRKKQIEEESLQTKEKQTQPAVHTVVLQEDGFYDQPVKNQPAKQHGSVSEEQLKRRKELMNRIKNRIVQDF